MTVHLFKPTDNDHPPFDARDLSNVVDRVKTPFSIEVNGAVLPVWFVNRGYADTVQVYTDSDAVDYVNVEGTDTVELVGPVTVLDADDDVIAYGTRDGEMLCAGHGAPFDIGVQDGAVWPVLRDQGDALDVVEWCSHTWPHGQHGHSFCGTCGTDLQTMHGAHDRDVQGHFAYCWNCHTSSVYVDGEGFVWCDGFGSVLDVCTVDVDGPRVTYQTDLNGHTKITHVIDESPRLMRELQCFVSWQEARPYDGVILTLADSWESADESAMEHALDALDDDDRPSDDDELSDYRAGFRTVEVPVDHVWFHTKN